jgi:hypothetical protein
MVRQLQADPSERSFTQNSDGFEMQEKRHHRRLNIRLPLEFQSTEDERNYKIRTVTRNISTGGVYFELDLMPGVRAPSLYSRLDIDLVVPPGDGYFPYQGKVSSEGEVVRCHHLNHSNTDRLDGHSRVGVAARFRKPLKLSF